MKNPNDLWEALGSLAEDEVFHVITKLFAIYEEKLEKNPDNAEALQFFNKLDIAISQSTICNLNRR